MATQDLDDAKILEDDQIGDFPFHHNDSSSKTNDNQPQDSGIKVEDKSLRTLYLWNYWHRYNSVVLDWPTCDGRCGNKLGKLIHNALYQSTASSPPSSELADTLYIDTYQLTVDDIEAIKSFSSLQPMAVQSDAMLCTQVLSFLDNLRLRIEEYTESVTEIAREEEIHDIISKDIECALSIKEIISKHFVCYSTPIRRFLISLLDSFDESDNITSYRALLRLLKDKEHIICDDVESLNIWSRLLGLSQTGNCFILHQLARYSCLYCNHTLFEELKRNGFHTISPNLYTQDMVRIIKSKEHGVMRRYDLELTAEEIIAILIYTGRDQISKDVRDSLIRERQSCKWRHFMDNLMSSAEKMHKVLVQTKRREELPSNLYYAVNATIGRDRVDYFNVLSTTDNIEFVSKFMKRGTVITFEGSDIMLQSPRFIAAPLDWITSRNNTSSKRVFCEWLVVAVKVHDAAVTHSEDGTFTKIRQIRCTEYESIPFRSVSTWRTVVDASMILDRSNAVLRSASNAAILKTQKWRCIHCGCESPMHWFRGNVLLDNMECPCCRRLNVFAFNVDQRMVRCFNGECQRESALREFVIDRQSGKGALCPQCKQWQSDCFIDSESYQLMTRYLSDDTEYEKAHEMKENQNAVSFHSINYRNPNMINSGGAFVVDRDQDQDEEEKSNGKSSLLFRWNLKDRKKTKRKSMNLSNVEPTGSVIEDDFD